jgi:hypothetical protein
MRSNKKKIEDVKKTREQRRNKLTREAMEMGSMKIYVTSCTRPRFAVAQCG